ncbi:hypothetical protein SUGI_0529590 [Cryptomeria japonica]|nr:hypothetical protein SUGI_0529590 [Cryptomeria japonica]
MDNSRSFCQDFIDIRDLGIDLLNIKVGNKPSKDDSYNDGESIAQLHFVFGSILRDPSGIGADTGDGHLHNLPFWNTHVGAQADTFVFSTGTKLTKAEQVYPSVLQGNPRLTTPLAMVKRIRAPSNELFCLTPTIPNLNCHSRGLLEGVFLKPLHAHYCID